MPRSPRPSASIIVLAWNAIDATRGCLETLRPSLGARDNVIVVDQGSHDDTATLLRRQRWVTTIVNPENVGVPAGRNQAAAAAGVDGSDVLVFLDNDTVLLPGWLDRLLAPFADADVAAVGPMSNRMGGAQLVTGVGYAHGDRKALRQFVNDFQQQHRRQSMPVQRLDGSCLAVRREAFAGVGGFGSDFGLGGGEENADLCRRLTDEGWRLAVARDAYVHHDGGITRRVNGVTAADLASAGQATAGAAGVASSATAWPRLSAALIVKDEEALLGDCLASITPHVDEIVVYDTGSTDATVAIAREAGATVIEGFWDDDFGRARNEALAACSGEWVLSIDADERLTDVSADLVGAVANAASTDVFRLQIRNLKDNGSIGLTHWAPRLFRRERGRWDGRLHEQIRAVGGTELRFDDLGIALLDHLGYTDELMTGRDKAARNVRIAEAAAAAAAEGDEDDKARAALDLGKSLTSEGRYDKALEQFRLAEESSHLSVRRAAVRDGAQALLVSGRPEDALEWIERMRAISVRTETPDLLESMAYLQMGEPDKALALQHDEVAEVVDDNGLGLPRPLVEVHRGILHLQLGETAAAADNLLPHLMQVPLGVWGAMLHSFQDDERLSDVIEQLDFDAGRRLDEIIALMTELPTPLADACAESLHTARPDDLRVAAIVARIADRLDLERAITWSGRLRGLGVTRCPLVQQAASPDLPGGQRVIAGALLGGIFADASATTLAADAARRLDTSDFLATLYQVGELAPEMLATVVTAAASTPSRSFELAKALEQLGAAEQAAVMVQHGLEQGPDAETEEEGRRLLASLSG